MNDSSYFLLSPSSTVTLEQWENISDLNMAKAVQQKSNSMSLRALAESVLQQTAADMQKQFQATTAAFQLNIHQIKFTKDQMELKLPKVGHGLQFIVSREGEG